MYSGDERAGQKIGIYLPALQLLAVRQFAEHDLDLRSSFLPISRLGTRDRTRNPERAMLGSSHFGVRWQSVQIIRGTYLERG